jgi:hypothetical protein
VIFASVHVENPNCRAFSTIARIGCPAARWPSRSSSNSSCHGDAINGTSLRDLLTILATPWKSLPFG